MCIPLKEKTMLIGSYSSEYMPQTLRILEKNSSETEVRLEQFIKILIKSKPRKSSCALWPWKSRKSSVPEERPFLGSNLEKNHFPSSHCIDHPRVLKLQGGLLKNLQKPLQGIFRGAFGGSKILINTTSQRKNQYSRRKSKISSQT